MAYPLSYLRAASPLRPADWRYWLALALLDAGRVPTWEDDALEVFLALLRWLRQPKSSDNPMPEAFDPYQRALEIYLAADETCRGVLEAHLLSGRQPEDAARALAVPSAVAQAYAAVFLDWSDQARCRVVAVQVDRVRRASVPTLDKVLCAYAAANGPLVLDDLLHAFGLGGYALTPAYAGADRRRLDLARRAGVAMFVVPASCAAAACTLLKLNLEAQRLESLRGDPRRYARAEIGFFKAQLAAGRRIFGPAALRNNGFLRQLLAP